MTPEQFSSLYLGLGCLTGLVSLVIFLYYPVKTLTERKIFFDDHDGVWIEILFAFLGAVLAAGFWPATWAFGFVYGVVMAIVFLVRRRRQMLENPSEKPKRDEKFKNRLVLNDGAVLQVVEEPDRLRQAN